MATPQLSAILQAAKEVLTNNHNRAMHVNEIAKEAVATNKNMGMTESEFAIKVSAALAQNVKTKTPTFLKPINSKTKKARKGFYKLKRAALKPTVTIPKLKTPAVNTSFMGTAGEHAVASELLFWGFNIAKTSVDEGIDLIVETRPNTFRYVQVKTSTSKADGLSYEFSIDEKAFSATASRNPWYIFVMRQDQRNTFAVIPFGQLSLLKQQGVIRGTNKLSIQITRDEQGRQFKLCGIDINLFIGNFSLLANLS